MKKRITAVLAAAVLAFAPASAAYGHGYVEAPKSRALWCKTGEVTGCGDIQWEPQSVEAPKGFPQAGPADGQICSGGIARFSQLDDPDKNWPLTFVKPGSRFEFDWHLTASHKTSKWEYFVTKDGWDPAQKLTRAALEPAPFYTHLADPDTYPPQDTRHIGTMPHNKTGRHLILAVWTIADTPNAFYQCADVNFGG